MATVTEKATAITAIISLVTSMYNLGEKVWPQLKVLIGNLQTLWLAYTGEKEITDDELTLIQIETASMSEECNRLYKEKYEA